MRIYRSGQLSYICSICTYMEVDHFVYVHIRKLTTSVYAHIRNLTTSVYAHIWKLTTFVYAHIRKWSTYCRICGSGRLPYMRIYRKNLPKSLPLLSPRFASYFEFYPQPSPPAFLLMQPFLLPLVICWLREDNMGLMHLEPR
jgi:hypothetical protein